MENQEQIFEFNIPAGVQDTRVEPAIIAGAEKSKSPFETSQRESAAFANRMVAANSILNAIEESGFNPVNAKDIAIENAPFIPKLFEGFLTSPKYKQYEQAKRNYLLAQLRDESGAAIAEHEVESLSMIYFPVVGDDPATIAQKKETRKKGVESMKIQAGNAYKDTVTNNPVETAKLELIKRAETNPDLRKELINRGIIIE
jgi:hypothetical protein